MFSICGTWLISPIGVAIPFIINIANDTKSIGVNTFPITSTTFDFVIVSAITIKKNIIENTSGLKLGNSGNILISKVVAAVLGITTAGPIHVIIVKPNSKPILLSTLDDIDTGPSFS